MDALGPLPFTAPGLGIIGVLLGIIFYLFRLNALDRRDAATRLLAIDEECAKHLQAERDYSAAERAREAEEREWLHSFYEARLEVVTKRFQEEITQLRAEMDINVRRVQEAWTAADEERRLRIEVEAELAKTKRRST